MLWIRAGGGCMGVGETLKHFKRGGEAKILRKKGQAGSRDGCFKKGRGLEPPYETMMFTSTL